MRISIHIDSAPTQQVRDLAAALSLAGLRESLTVGCDGPELWSATTPMMTPQQHATVIGRLVKYHGTPIADALRSNQPTPERTQP